ncbi:alpha/beta hydrolase [Botrimarina sp.]|uniref:alpha/beta hydrolase n=1 Tax=Botrimarina sp. TaxID=2795802 RepID=UPI0032EFD78C
MSGPPRPSRGRRGWRVVRAVLIAYLVVLLGMTFLERRLVYPAPQLAWGNWSPTGDDYEDVWIDVEPVGRSKNASRVHGWLFDRENADFAILYCHGNGEDVSNQPLLARRLRDELNAVVLAFDYRGYGKSEGLPHESGVVADGLAAAGWLAARAGCRPDELVLVGRSLGGGVATAIAAEQGAAALVLQSTFSRLIDAAAHHYPWLPVRWVMRNRFDSLARLKRYQGPVLVSHGTEDNVVPIEQGRRLFEAAVGRKSFVELAGLGHVDPQPTWYYGRLKAFLAGSDAAVPPSEGVATAN